MNQVSNLNPGLQAAQAALAAKKAAKEAATKEAAAKPRKERHTMGVVERTKLATLIEQTYTTSRLNDVEFALEAAKTLGFEVNTSTVTSIREAYGIAAPEALTLAQARARIRAMEDELAVLKSPPSIE